VGSVAGTGAATVDSTRVAGSKPEVSDPGPMTSVAEVSIPMASIVALIDCSAVHSGLL
jgi:hypothetical protein